MDKVKIILENGSEAEVHSIFYLYNSKYYFMYTTKEIDENGYVILHLVQVGKELKNTPEGPIDTGYMVGVEISNPDEWKAVQESITKIVDDKKNNTKNSDIQYLPISMLSTLKIVSKKNFRLMKNIIENDFKLNIDEPAVVQNINTLPSVETSIQNNNLEQIINPDPSIEVRLQNSNLQQPINMSAVPLSQMGQQAASNIAGPLDADVLSLQPGNSEQQPIESINDLNTNAIIKDSNIRLEESNTLYNNVVSENNSLQNDVIIDYRARFFEEQEKNEQLQLKINELEQKIESIKQVIE